MMGDFNWGTGCRKNVAIFEGFGEDIVYDNGERLTEFCSINVLKITNVFYKHKDILKYRSYKHSRQLKTIIDYIITKQRTELKLFDGRIQKAADYSSDYFMIEQDLHFLTRPI